MVNGISGGTGNFPSMKTADTSRTPAAPDAARTRRAAPPEPPAVPPAAPTRLERIAADLAVKPPVDQSRVEALKLAIAAGTYKPDPVRIAGAMIAQESAGLKPAG
jgi:negative regulator of flagellin synthesis FlgM